MNCAEFIDIIKSGQPFILRRNSREYIRLSENSLSIVTEDGVHVCLWLAENRKFKRIIRSISPDRNWKIDTLFLGHFRETTGFLRRWEELRLARNWAPNANFPGLHEIASFVYLTLVPEYWMICLEREGQPAAEALPVIEPDQVCLDNSGYDF